jgi:hypothetical protein
VTLVEWLTDSRPLGVPPEASRSLAQVLPELILAGIVVVVALFSLRKWLRVRFAASSLGEQVLFSLHITSRVGTWFALAGFFLGYAIVDEPQNFGWYVFVLIGLASIQLLTSFFLWRSPGPSDHRRDEMGG